MVITVKQTQALQILLYIFKKSTCNICTSSMFKAKRKSDDHGIGQDDASNGPTRVSYVMQRTLSLKVIEHYLVMGLIYRVMWSVLVLYVFVMPSSWAQNDCQK